LALFLPQPCRVGFGDLRLRQAEQLDGQARDNSDILELLPCRSLTAGFDLRAPSQARTAGQSCSCVIGRFFISLPSNQLAAAGKIERARPAGPVVPILQYDQLVSTLLCWSAHPGEHQQGDFHGVLSGRSGSNVEHFTAAQERDGEA
jgi:hypothetical protein